MAWLLRHPLFVLVPAAGLALAIWWGWRPVVIALGSVVLTVLVWARVHPPSFDRWPGPILRAGWRRWTCYRGRRWRDVLADCELARINRRTGALVVPRVARVRSSTPTLDTVYVRMARGQDLRTWTDRADALAHALGAHRVAITKLRPAVLAVVVEREMPFTQIVPAPEIPASVEDVDLGAVDIGDNEYGESVTIPVRGGNHTIVSGRSGAGKSGPMNCVLRGVGPMIPAGLVRVTMLDLKGGAETTRSRPLFHRYATTMSDALTVLGEVREEMKHRQAWLTEQKLRHCPVSPVTPLELVLIDEMAMLTAYGERGEVREALRLLAEILTQGRAAEITVFGFVQEPTKDVVDVRELFPQRICLAVTAASHVDMVLGDGARERGALADEIPVGPEHAGIGYLIEPRSRLPIRFRAALVTDADIDELVARCGLNNGSGLAVPGQVIDLPHPDEPDRRRDDEGVA